jgi:hypothetical protein
MYQPKQYSNLEQDILLAVRDSCEKFNSASMNDLFRCDKLISQYSEDDIRDCVKYLIDTGELTGSPRKGFWVK